MLHFFGYVFAVVMTAFFIISAILLIVFPTVTVVQGIRHMMAGRRDKRIVALGHTGTATLISSHVWELSSRGSRTHPTLVLTAQRTMPDGSISTRTFFRDCEITNFPVVGAPIAIYDDPANPAEWVLPFYD